MRTVPLHLALLLALAGAPAAHAATPLDTRHARQTITLDFFLEACTGVGDTAYGMVPHFDCESYVYGLLDTQAALPKAQRACVPEHFAPWQAYELMLQEPPPSAAARRGTAAPAILTVLRKAHPCR